MDAPAGPLQPRIGLLLRAPAPSFHSLRQQPLGKVQALLSLTQLLAQPAQLEFERFKLRLELAAPPPKTRPQALGP